MTPPDGAAGAAAADTGAGNGAGAGAAGTGTPWYSGKITESADIGWLQNRGWHDKPANDVAIEAIKSFRNLEKMHGVPAEQLVKWPKDLSDEAGWANVRERLGVPKDAKDYDFSAVKWADGKAVDDESFLTAMRETAAKLHLPKDAAPEIAQMVVKQIEAVEAAETAEKNAYYTAENDKLAKSWGVNAEANLFVAKNAMKAVAKAAGLDEPAMVKALEAMEGAMGKAHVMQMFLAIGQKIGEDRFVTSDTGRGQGGVMTREQAKARFEELKKDAGWQKKFFAGDVEAKQLYDSLVQLMTPSAA